MFAEHFSQPAKLLRFHRATHPSARHPQPRIAEHARSDCRMKTLEPQLKRKLCIAQERRAPSPDRVSGGQPVTHHALGAGHGVQL
eukprot:6355177-Lingulodinium_polyedra.AAC.1